MVLGWKLQTARGLKAESQFGKAHPDVQVALGDLL